MRMDRGRDSITSEHKWQPIPSCHSQKISGNPSPQVVIPKTWHQWQPIPSRQSNRLASLRSPLDKETLHKFD
eukprot:158219-Amphidinium_carterae.1